MKKSGFKKMLAYRDFVYVVLSALMILTILVNSLILALPWISALASVVYIAINGRFVGNGIFKGARLRLPLGVLFLVVLLGILGWLFMLFLELGVKEVVLVLCIAASLSYLIYKFEVVKETFLRRLGRMRQGILKGTR